MGERKWPGGHQATIRMPHEQWEYVRSIQAQQHLKHQDKNVSVSEVVEFLIGHAKTALEAKRGLP